MSDHKRECMSDGERRLNDIVRQFTIIGRTDDDKVSWRFEFRGLLIESDSSISATKTTHNPDYDVRRDWRDRVYWHVQTILDQQLKASRELIHRLDNKSFPVMMEFDAK